MSELKFNYKIEPKPGGGFIARPSNPALPVFEGATKEEVEQKMEARLLEMMDEKLDQLHLGNLKAAIHTKVNIQHHHITAPSQPTASQPQQFSSSSSSASGSSGPIIMESQGSGQTVLKIIVALVVAALALLYWRMHH